MMSFFYSANGVVLPIFIRQVFGQTQFVSNVGFLWLSYPVGSVLITILVKALFGTIHFTGFSVSIAFCHFISFYTAHAMKKAHNKYLLQQISKTNHTDDTAQENYNVNSHPCSEARKSVSEEEHQISTYNALRKVLAL